MLKKGNLSKSQIIDIVMGVIMQVYYFFPWIHVGESRNNIIIYFIQGLRTGDFVELYKKSFLAGIENLTDMVQLAALWFWIFVIAIMIIQIGSLTYIFASIRGYQPRLLHVTAWLVIAVISSVIVSMGMEGFTIVAEKPVSVVPVSVYLYLLLFVLMEGVWILSGKAAEEWDEASRRLKEERKQIKAYRRERKKRLYFPGNYSKLYYRVLWENFKYHWNDFSFLFLVTFLSSLFVFCGISMRNVFANSYGEDQGMLGLGLVEIMRDFLVVIILISLFLITVVLVFYRKKRMVNTGLFKTLGIRTNSYFASWIGELAGCFVVATAGGLVVGRLFLFCFSAVMEYSFPALGKLGSPGGLSYVGTVLGMLIICLFAFGFSHDIQQEKESADARGAAVRSEKLPGPYRYAGLCISLALAVGCIYRYSQRRTMESILLLSVFLISLYVIMYNLWGILLKRKERKLNTYISSLPEIHMIRHKYQTTVRYVSLLAVIHISVLFFFMMKMVSNQIATAPEEIFPYDYMFLANSEDDGFMNELKDECKGEIITFPMVRATTVDTTEMPDKPNQISYQQGQNIGVSEKTYRELKRLVGEVPERDLNLDGDGKSIYIVYQQDQGSKAKPLDWYMGTKLPYVHIGQPLTAYNAFEYRDYYPQRMIAGEERASLTGCFRQGKYGNLVVMSDTYFEKVKDSWKTTDMYTGEALKGDEAIPGETIHEGPSRLVLVNVSEEYKERADEIMGRFQNAHTFDESFDVLVKSAYAKEEAVNRRHMEHLLEITINGFVIIMLMTVSILLLHMKVKMEIPEMQKRYRFMECFGMRQQERIKAEKREISRFLWIPLGLSAVVVPVFTTIVFKLRDFQVEDMLRYGKYAGVVCFTYVLVQVINLKYLQHMATGKVEKSIGK